jgi:trigger factor
MAFTYRGLSAKLDRHIVTDAEIDRQLQRLQQQTPRIAVVTDRPTESGDEVVLDYAGFCDGVQFPGGTAEKQTLVLGSGTFIPGFEEQLLDKVVGEKVTVHVTFPQQYHSEDLAGKAAEFRCVIHEIRVKTAYDLDDTFAKEVGGCDTLEQMREKLAGSLQAYTDERGEMELQDNLLRQAAATLDMEVSEAQIEAALDEHMNTLKAQLAQQGLSIEMYCQFMGTDEKQLRSDARAEAQQSVRVQAAIEEIIKLEQLTATEEEKGEAIALIARQNRMTVDQLTPYRNAEFDQAVRNGVLHGKVLQFIRANAIITE